MDSNKYEFLPEVQEIEIELDINSSEIEFLPQVKPNIENNKVDKDEVIGDSPCPCCGYITIPNNGDALAYICPICFWELDLFIKSDSEPSDQNHGLTLNEARQNYKEFGAVLARFKQHCREPKEYEYPNEK